MFAYLHFLFKFRNDQFPRIAATLIVEMNRGFIYCLGMWNVQCCIIPLGIKKRLRVCFLLIKIHAPGIYI